MPHSHPHSDHSSSSSRSASESFCLSSCSNYDSNFQASPSIQPNLKTKPQLTSKADPTIYSFAWSESNSENPSNQFEIVSSSMSTSGIIDPRRNPQIPAAEAAVNDYRLAPPTLPHPICWTSLTHLDIFKEYISAEHLGEQGSSSDTPSEETQETTQETRELLSKNYSNTEHINAANTNKFKIVPNVPSTWVDNHILACRCPTDVPVPFNSDLVSENNNLWLGRNLQEVGDHTFCRLPDTTSKKAAMEWCNSIGHSLGVIHGLVLPTNSTDQASRNDQLNIQLGHIFYDGGCKKPLLGGYIKWKPDIILIDCTTKCDLASNGRVGWPLVQALVEVSIWPNHHHKLVDIIYVTLPSQW